LNNPNTADLARIGTALRERARQLGFQRLGVTGIELDRDRAYLERWLQLGRHGDMAYMARHGSKRSAPEQLVPGTCRVICVRMDYLPEAQADARAMLERPDRAYIARYALGRDYHKLMRRRLQQLADWLRDRVVELHDRVVELHDEGAATHDRAPAMRFRVFVDSAPVLERALARNAGLGWIGKHTNLLDRQAGSWFLLGEIYTDLPLPCDSPVSEHCGSFRACIDVCPTQAIVAPYELDARRCISYLTIEQTGPIPVEFRFRERLLRQHLKTLLQVASEVGRAVAVNLDVLKLDFVEHVADFPRGEMGVIQDLDELLEGLLEVDVVLPQRVVGIDQE
jgi:epoxyqueuosine reductase